VAELVALRLSLPARLSREPLDTLLAKLTPAVRPSIRTERSRLSRRDILLAERGIARLSWVPGTCLYRSLARYAILRKTGIDAAFVMGLGPGGVGDNGHAWVELEGKPFEERDDVSRYTVTFRYPPAPNDGKPVAL
jgi:transglutaminase superfamily protein